VAIHIQMKVETLSLWTAGRSLVSWKDWFLLAGKAKGDYWWKRQGST